MSWFRLFPDSRPAILRGALAVSLLASVLAACSSSPPPTMADVKKLVAEDRTFDALQTLIPMAQGGDPQAQYELAGFYHYGYVGANDYAKALKWYRASARQGYADAMVGLSVMYLGGQGVAKDPREAFVWLNLAAQYMTDKQALAKIKRIRDEIGRGFTKDDIAYAKAESLLLQPETSSVQPNEAESIDHLPEQLQPAGAATTNAPATNAPATTEPLQNVPPETAPLGDIPLQNALPAPPSKPLTVPSGALPSAGTAGTSLPTTTVTQPSAPLPATTAPATPIIPPATTEAPPSDSEDTTTAPSSATQVQPVPKF
ncbi:MAG TPA: hypothetical protein VHA35_08485 [Dongiaceae bacterium]|jgi:hypothetical protein|nr:hypothetical protein [Dongiaceae bacterium]